MSDWIRKIEDSKQAIGFVPPPSGVVTIEAMKRRSIGYWKTKRIIELSGFDIKWAIPSSGIGVSSSQAATSLDVRLQPIFDIHPHRTATFEIEDYILCQGRPHVEPSLGVSVELEMNAIPSRKRLASSRSLPVAGDLLETARWLPEAINYVEGIWQPVIPPTGLDANIRWVGSSWHGPVYESEYEYKINSQWVSHPVVSLEDFSHMTLQNVPMSSGRITIFVVAIITPPSNSWVSLLTADTPTALSSDERDDIDLRLSTDGRLHAYAEGWHGSLPLVTDAHSPCVFGISLDSADPVLTFFTMDRSPLTQDVRLLNPHSTTSTFFLGRAGIATVTLNILDIAYFRGDMSTEDIHTVLNKLDELYGVTTPDGTYGE